MRCRSIVSLLALVVSAVAASCTQDFNQFEPTLSSAASGASSGTSGSGGAGGTTSETTASSTSSTSASSTSASSTSAASSSAASSSSSASSSTATGTLEDCINHVDDDGDGDVDCADSDCGGFVCIPDAPPAWNGPVALFDGDPGMKPAGCPSEHPLQSYEGFRDLAPTPAVCSACSCSAPNVTCSPMQLELDTAACAQPKGFVVQPPPGQCGSVSPPAGVASYKASAPTGFTGACTPAGGTPTLPPPNWGGASLACGGGGLGGGCGNKSSCAAVSAPPFGAKLCVYRSGDLSCPGGFEDKHTFVNTVIDTRGCSPCTCGGGSATCSATTKVFSDGACATAIADVPNDGTCVAAAAGGSIQIQITKSGSCPANGGSPSGSLQEGPPKTTVCCVP